MTDASVPSSAEDLEREAQEAKLVRRDYTRALRLRLRLERLHEQTAASVSERTKNLNHIAHLAVRTGAVNEAERAARACVALYARSASESDERFATYLMMLSCVLAEARKFDEAVIHGEKAVAMFTRNHGEQDSFVAYRKQDIERMRSKDPRPYLDAT